MSNKMNLSTYLGEGETIKDRGLDLPPYKEIINPDDPKMYIAEPGLRDAVNVSIALGQPLLVTGEPGTGKSQLASSIAFELGIGEPLIFNAKTTSTAKDLFYQYDALRRFHDTQIPEKKNIKTKDYISFKALGLAILLTLSPDKVATYLPKDLKNKGPVRSVVLIDEIDKAPRDLPNDILNVIENMEFEVNEIEAEFKAIPDYRPIIILTSNSEKNLPEAFLRRCIFYHISFPDKTRLVQIVQKRFQDYPEITPGFINHAIDLFNTIRKLSMKKKPATAELLAWIHVIRSLDIKIEKIEPGQAEILALSFSILAKNLGDFKILKEEIYELSRQRQ